MCANGEILRINSEILRCSGRVLPRETPHDIFLGSSGRTFKGLRTHLMCILGDGLASASPQSQSLDVDEAGSFTRARQGQMLEQEGTAELGGVKRSEQRQEASCGLQVGTLLWSQLSLVP